MRAVTTSDGARRHLLQEQEDGGSSTEDPSPRARTAKRFTDLFAGIGGFHVALSRLGHECVYACEIDQTLRAVYEQNFGMVPAGDIRHLNAEHVPHHEILCAGFPCQPFSLAGKLEGPECELYGQLINHAFRIIKARQPMYVMLENVPNVLTIADGRFWKRIKAKFTRFGYALDYRIYSPEEFGVPQRRNRLFVVASRRGLAHFKWPEPRGVQLKPLSAYVLPGDGDIRCIETEKVRALDIWNRFVARMDYIGSDTILAAEFGATYPANEHPSSVAGWRKFKGAFGVSLKHCKTWKEALALLPHYARPNKRGVADWLKPFIEYSREVYSSDRKFLDEWKLDLIDFPNSWQKLDWRGDRRYRDIWKQTIQFRASGIRTMRPDFAPSLVAMTPTQTPIIGPLRRYMMVREAAALQSLEGLRVFPANNERAFRALGNAVNATIVEKIASQLIV
jgi:DNA (cytosine-5)-methyltransferase 1